MGSGTAHTHTHTQSVTDAAKKEKNKTTGKRQRERQKGSVPKPSELPLMLSKTAIIMREENYMFDDHQNDLPKLLSSKHARHHLFSVDLESRFEQKHTRINIVAYVFVACEIKKYIQIHI